MVPSILDKGKSVFSFPNCLFSLRALLGCIMIFKADIRCFSFSVLGSYFVDENFAIIFHCFNIKFQFLTRLMYLVGSACVCLSRHI